jgi:proteasome accessory factor B
VAGRDLDKKAIRLFRLDRIDSKISAQGKSASYEIPDDFVMSQHLASPAKIESATLKIRRGKAEKIAALSQLISEDDEWITVQYPFSQQSELLSDVLWHLDDIELVSPQSARDAIISTLQEIGADHL